MPLSNCQIVCRNDYYRTEAEPLFAKTRGGKYSPSNQHKCKQVSKRTNHKSENYCFGQKDLTNYNNPE